MRVYMRMCAYTCVGARARASIRPFMYTSTRKENERDIGVGKRGCADTSEKERERKKKEIAFINTIASKRENPPKAYIITKKLMREYNNRAPTY